MSQHDWRKRRGEVYAELEQVYAELEQLQARYLVLNTEKRELDNLIQCDEFQRAAHACGYTMVTVTNVEPPQGDYFALTYTIKDYPGQYNFTVSGMELSAEAARSQTARDAHAMFMFVKCLADRHGKLVFGRGVGRFGL